MKKITLIFFVSVLLFTGVSFAQNGQNANASAYVTIDTTAADTTGPTTVGTEGNNLLLWGDITGKNYVYVRIYSKDFVSTKEYAFSIVWDKTYFEIESTGNDVSGTNIYASEANIYGANYNPSNSYASGTSDTLNIWGNTSPATSNNGLLAMIRFKKKANGSGNSVFMVFNMQTIDSNDVRDKLEENVYGGTAVAIAAVQDAGPIIPVELSAFTVTGISENDLKLEWTTASETNNYGFEIQRSTDGVKFKKIGFVKGNGTTSNINHYSFVDEDLNSGLYYYRLKQIDFDGTYSYSEIIKAEVKAPDSYGLGQNYPNPFNPVTTIPFRIKEAGKVKIKVFNILGQEVATIVNKVMQPGYYKETFNASDLASGMYFYVMIVNGKTFMKKFVLLK